jgi:hypothetical protein
MISQLNLSILHYVIWMLKVLATLTTSHQEMIDAVAGDFEEHHNPVNC